MFGSKISTVHFREQMMAADAHFSDADVGDILDKFLLHHNHPAERSPVPSLFDPNDVVFGSDPLTALPDGWQPDSKDAVLVGFVSTCLATRQFGTW